MKGFKKDGKFIPTEKRNKSALTTGSIKFKKPISFSDDEFKEMKLGWKIPEQKVINVFDISELSPEAKENALNHGREFLAEIQDDWYAQDDGIIFDDSKKVGYDEIGLTGNKVTSWDISFQGRDYIAFGELEVEDEVKFGKYLGLPKKIVDKIEFRFSDSDDSESNTELFFNDVNGEAIDLYDDYNPKDYVDYIEKADILTTKEFEKLGGASEKFDQLMKYSLNHLRDNYEHTQSDEYSEDMAINNDWKFDSNGKFIGRSENL